MKINISNHAGDLVQISCDEFQFNSLLYYGQVEILNLLQPPYIVFTYKNYRVNNNNQDEYNFSETVKIYSGMTVCHQVSHNFLRNLLGLPVTKRAKNR